MRKTVGAVAGLALGAWAGAAQANDFHLVDWNGTQVWGAEWTPDTKLAWDLDNIDVWYRIYFEGYTDEYKNGNEVLPGLASTVLFRLKDISVNMKEWTFEYVVENASNQWVTRSRVSAFGFDVSPNVKTNGGVGLFAGGGFRTAGRGDFDPVNNLLIDDDFDVCFTTKGSFGRHQATNTSNDCTPGDDVGPRIGESATGKFTLKFNSAQDDLFFDNPFVAYSDIDYTEPNARGGSGGSWYDKKYGKGHKHGPGCGHSKKDEGGYGLPVAWVPEPSTWAMMILGFGLVGTMVRRRAATAVRA